MKIYFIFLSFLKSSEQPFMGVIKTLLLAVARIIKRKGSEQKILKQKVKEPQTKNIPIHIADYIFKMIYY